MGSSTFKEELPLGEVEAHIQKRKCDFLYIFCCSSFVHKLRFQMQKFMLPLFFFTHMYNITGHISANEPTKRKVGVTNHQDYSSKTRFKTFLVNPLFEATSPHR